MSRKLKTPYKSRSVELYNPSIYTGMFIRKFDVPIAYTRTITYPTHNAPYVTKQYVTNEKKYDMLTKNSNTPLWNVPDVLPLQNRRRILL